MAPPPPRNTPRGGTSANKTWKSPTVYLSPYATRSPIRPGRVMNHRALYEPRTFYETSLTEEKRLCETRLKHERPSRP